MALALRKSWSTDDPELLQEELQDFQRSVDDELIKLGARGRVRPSSIDDVFATYGDFLRLDPTSAGLTLTLPPAIPAVAGTFVEAVIESAEGSVTVQVVNGLIDGEEEIILTPRRGRARFTCDGSGWYLGPVLPVGSVTSADIADGTIVDADIATAALIALSKLATQAANTLVANATGSAAVPTAVSVGANTVVGRVAGNLVAAALVNAQVDANAAIALSKLATQAANTAVVNATGSTAVPTALAVGTNTVLGRVAGNIVAAGLVNAQVDANAAIAVSKIATIEGRLLRAPQVLTSGTSINHPAGTRIIFVRGTGGGGAGGGNSASTYTFGAQGGSATYAEKTYTAASLTSTYAIGAAGTGVSGAAGNNGGSTTFTHDGVTLTIPGGTGGGINTTAVGTEVVAAGGAGGGSATNEDFEVQGNRGGDAVRFADATEPLRFHTGPGGSTPWGHGAPARAVTDNTSISGAVAEGFGAGGGGRLQGNSASANAGGDGTPGVLIVEEYT